MDARRRRDDLARHGCALKAAYSVDDRCDGPRSMSVHENAGRVDGQALRVEAVTRRRQALQILASKGYRRSVVERLFRETRDGDLAWYVGGAADGHRRAILGCRRSTPRANSQLPRIVALARWNRRQRSGALLLKLIS